MRIRDYLVIVAIVLMIIALSFATYKTGKVDGWWECHNGYREAWADATAGGGGTWETAFNTIDAAMADTSADRGDTIYIDSNKDWGTKPESIDVNEISEPNDWTISCGGVRGNFTDDGFVPLNKEEAAIAKRLWLNDYGEEWRREGYYSK